MVDFRSEAEKFVSYFLDYIYKDDIKDHLDRRTQKMVRSAGVEDLVRRAEAVFPKRTKIGKEETDKLTTAEVDKAIADSPNVVDTRDMFSKRVARNGGTQKLLRELYADEPGARDRVAEFLAAEDGETQFAKE